MSRRGSSKRLVVFGLLLAIVAGAGWVTRDRLEVVGRPLVERATAMVAPQTHAAPSPTGAAPVRATTRASRDSVRQPASAQPAGPRGPQSGIVSDSARGVVRQDDRTAPALVLKSVPTIGSGTDIDAVTSDVEHATKSKLETAQKSLLDVKPPIFKKP